MIPSILKRKTRFVLQFILLHPMGRGEKKGSLKIKGSSSVEVIGISSTEMCQKLPSLAFPAIPKSSKKQKLESVQMRLGICSALVLLSPQWPSSGLALS